MTSHAAHSDLLQAVLRDSQIAVETVRELGQGGAQEAVEPAQPGAQQASWVSYSNASEAANSMHSDLARGKPTGTLYVVLDSPATDRDLAALRNRLWPRFHVGQIYLCEGGRLRRRTLQGMEDKGGCSGSGLVLIADPKEKVMSQGSTTTKFDQNAKKWDGERGAPGYPHFRWMRRYVGLYAGAAKGPRILDFGCGAGWVGIEAAMRSPGSHLAFFDPSPEMVKIAEANGLEQGLQDLVGRVGFGEAPPFPTKGEARYDCVISSGVISFSPDPEAWIEGLLGTLAPGSTLIIGDIQARSWGFRKRRKSHPLLPVRELNAKTDVEVRSALEEAGLRFLKGSGYQCSFPIPQIMHVNETKLRGVLTRPLLWLNQLGAGISKATGKHMAGAFDSWVMAFRVPK